MRNNLPQHAAFRVAKKFNNNSGIISPEASARYGPTTGKPMLRFRDAIILFADERLYNAHQNRVEPARPVSTAMKAIALNMPLADIPEGELKVIIDGKTFIKSHDEGITELIQVDDRFLTSKNLAIPSQLIKAEQGWKTDRIVRDKEYISYMLEGNDQVSIALPKAGWNNLSGLLNFLFSEKELREGKVAENFIKEYGNLQTYIAYRNKKVAAGLVSTGLDYYFGDHLRRCALVPRRLSYHPGVLIYSAAEGTKVGATKTNVKQAAKTEATQTIKIVVPHEAKRKL